MAETCRSMQEWFSEEGLGSVMSKSPALRTVSGACVFSWRSALGP